MKNYFYLLLLLISASCTSDDDAVTLDSDLTTIATCFDGIKNGDEIDVDCGGSCSACVTSLSGILSTDTQLSKANSYELTGAYIVPDGITLTIDAGTLIKAIGGTSSYIAVAQGGKININGTATSPVVMTSGFDSPAASDWGGLVICGKAPTNVGATATSEVGELTYGGSDENDSSGSIQYLRVEYSGAAYNSEKEFNGISLFGVGAGTTFKYVQSYEGGDDGIEFFGGTVNGIYLVSVNSQDDSIDFADGWNGSGSYWYISGGAKAGIEGSNNGANGDATPVTITSLSNITVVGPVSEGALYFKEGGGQFTIDNFYASNVALGVKVKANDVESNTRLAAGELSISKFQFADVALGDLVKTDYVGDASWLGEGATSGAGNGAAAPSWTAGWTVGLDGATASTKANLEGEIDTEVTLNSSTEYLLTSSFIIKDGGTLNIPAGTLIKAIGGTSSYIAVAQGGKININGTATSPVVMTSGFDSPAASDWGGLVICGKAPTNVGATATSEVGDLTYGGTISNDNSGSIQYLRVEYSGAAYNSEKEFNGISLFGVGSGTTFEYVQSYEGGDDGIEFFGGTVVGNYLISTGSQDDSIDFADGWNGSGSYWYISGGAKAGIEGSNNGSDGNATPVTTVTLSNISVVGPVTEGALYFKEGGGNFTINNFFVSVLEDEVIKVKSTDSDAQARLTNGDLKITNLTGAMDMAFLSPDFDFTSYANITQTTTATGAGNGATMPDWSAGWAK
jgi:hypothetical protein